MKGLLDREHIEGCYIVILILLISILIHRAILMNFGLWRTSHSDEFDTRYFKVIKSDIKSSQILHNISNLEIKDHRDDDDGNSIIRGSEELLIGNDEDEMILYRHELDMSVVDDNQMVLRPRFRNQQDILSANFRIKEDNMGTKHLKIKQEHIELLLEPINNENTGKFSSQTVEVETEMEENTSKFKINLLTMALKKYFLGDSSFKIFLESKPAFQRAQYDVYKYTVLFEILNFLVLLFGFSEFNVSITLFVIVRFELFPLFHMFSVATTTLGRRAYNHPVYNRQQSALDTSFSARNSICHDYRRQNLISQEESQRESDFSCAHCDFHPRMDFRLFSNTNWRETQSDSFSNYFLLPQVCLSDYCGLSNSLWLPSKNPRKLFDEKLCRDKLSRIQSVSFFVKFWKWRIESCNFLLSTDSCWFHSYSKFVQLSIGSLSNHLYLLLNGYKLKQFTLKFS